MIHQDILSTIGNTPIVRLNEVAKGLKNTIGAKLEYFNPGGSVKDRIGLHMIEVAEEKGLLKPGGTIIEGTSGNTGMGLAIAAAIKGYSCIFVMPDKMSQEKIDALRAFGAEVIVTPTAVEPEDPRSYYSVSDRLAEEIPNSHYPNQYQNPSNPETHYQQTGPEIWEQTDGKITHFVAGMGTGGTLTGVGRYLKEKNPDIQIVGVDPVGSIYYDYYHHDKIVEAETYFVEGIGEDFLPSTMDLDVLDDVVRVNDRDSMIMTRALARKEAIFVGSSGGAAVLGAIEVAEGADDDALIIVLMPDNGLRYLSKVHSDRWMEENRFLETRIELTARQILDKKRPTHPSHTLPELVSVDPDQLVFEAVTLMNEYEISQIPVMSDKECVGSVKEDQLIQLFMQGDEAKHRTIREVMDDPFPTLEANASLADVSRLLTRDNPAVLIHHGDEELEILTKADLIASLATR